MRAKGVTGAHSFVHEFILTFICHILALWAWENDLTALWLSFHFYKMG